MSPYVPILGVLFFSAILLAVMIVASLVIGPKKYNRVKYMPYECGIDPTPKATGGGRFPVKYYITAMMFLVFDIEIAFLYPWVVAFDQLSMFAVLSMIVFLLLLCIAYFYEYKRGGMEWD
ncbi:NADH-quinone oxidoreductase subunit A [Propioniciclava sinopodophylli]|uniref:NADH-quinone oxidoreductase subunit n=1 Tax=Propioniciclava sinopodophylli TaxID=1837344 RepID=A0A4Q9KCI0_9ACTN|nr:NADH-quinone oxidoreductase subunit A [Propioniciclava sinopodophylli]TBT83989.1 NADH-quinone oxidoreductase subunit A [Propioniciclava sinopodophylli]